MTEPQASDYRPSEEQIGFLLKRLMHLFRHLADQRLKHHADMTLAHLATLDQIRQEPGIAGARLAKRLMVTAQTMTGLLSRLEDDGSVERRADPMSRRADCWHLSPAGAQRLKAGLLAGQPVLTQMLSQLKAEEIPQLREYLQRCVDGLEQENRRNPAPLPDEDARNRSLANVTKPVAPPK